MKLSLGLPHYGKESSPEVIARFAREAEQLDYDAVWALERLLRPVKPRNAPFPGWTPPAYYANVYDPIETLTFVATKTQRIKLGTSVIDALFHVPVMLARRLATLDHFSAGRVVAGLGQGWSADEFETANVPMKRRGAGFEDFIGALRAAWSADPVRYDSTRLLSPRLGPSRCSLAARPYSSVSCRHRTARPHAPGASGWASTRSCPTGRNSRRCCATSAPQRATPGRWRGRSSSVSTTPSRRGLSSTGSP